MPDRFVSAIGRLQFTTRATGVWKLDTLTMRTTSSLAAFLVSLRLAAGHGDHGKDESGKPIEGDYALRHV